MFLLIVAVSAIFAASSRRIVDMKMLQRTVFTIAALQRDCCKYNIEDLHGHEGMLSDRSDPYQFQSNSRDANTTSFNNKTALTIEYGIC